MDGDNDIQGALREHWRWVAAAVLVVVGLYLGAHDYAIGRGTITAGASLGVCCGLAYTMAQNQELGELFKPGGKPGGLGIAFVATLVSLFLNHPALDPCRTKGYPILLEGAAYASLNATPPLDQYAKGLATRVAQACAVAPTSDQANLVASISEAQTDGMISRHTEIEPGLVRRLFDWQTPDANGSCVALLHGPAQWRPEPARRRRLRPDLTRDARLAVQAEPAPPPPHSQAEAQAHELA